MLSDLTNQVSAALYWFLSLFKRDWEMRDYPIRIREHEIDAGYARSRVKQYRYTASIVNWWVISGGGDTKRDALDCLEKRFENEKRRRAAEGGLPRPGTHVPIKFASRERLRRHEELADDFIRRVLNLDWAWISDQSSLFDFHASEDNRELIAKVQEIYRVDISDIESGNLAEILERIARSQDGYTRLLAL